MGYETVRAKSQAKKEDKGFKHRFFCSQAGFFSGLILLGALSYLTLFVVCRFEPSPIWGLLAGALVANYIVWYQKHQRFHDDN